jgi:hypothetical protein
VDDAQNPKTPKPQNPEHMYEIHSNLRFSLQNPIPLKLGDQVADFIRGESILKKRTRKLPLTAPWQPFVSQFYCHFLVPVLGLAFSLHFIKPETHDGLLALAVNLVSFLKEFFMQLFQREFWHLHPILLFLFA